MGVVSGDSGNRGGGGTSSVCSLDDDMLDYSDDELDSEISMDTMDYDFPLTSSAGDVETGRNSVWNGRNAGSKTSRDRIAVSGATRDDTLSTTGSLTFDGKKGSNVSFCK